MLYTLTLFLIITQIATAQDVLIDFKKVNDVYLSAKKMAVDITYKAYQNHTINTVQNSISGFYKRNNDKLHSSLYGIESIQNDQYHLVINEATKEMIIGKPKVDFGNMASENIELALANSKKVNYEENEKEKIYTVVFHQGATPYESVVFHINKRNFLLNKLVFFFNEELPSDPNDLESTKEKPRAELTYENFDLDPSFSTQEFSIDPYVNSENGKFTCTKSFADYLLYDQTISYAN